jgi:hypothetical protein
MKHPSQMITMTTIDGAIGSGGVRMKRRRGERKVAEMRRRSIIVIPSRREIIVHVIGLYHPLHHRIRHRLVPRHLDIVVVVVTVRWMIDAAGGVRK